MTIKILSFAPVVLTPVVILLIFYAGSDKTVTLIIPWVVFCLLYFLVYHLLARSIKSGVVLVIASTGIALLIGYAVSILLLYVALPIFGK